MKVSEMIEQLQAIQETFGDIGVFSEDGWSVRSLKYTPLLRRDGLLYIKNLDFKAQRVLLL